MTKVSCSVNRRGMEYASLDFDPPGFPRSRDYRDIYFSPHGGLEESRIVFIKGNHLPQRWQGKKRFVVGELGFGTGLNFLATWQCWERDPQRPLQLHYLSCENRPIPPDKMKTCLQDFPELNPRLRELVKQLPPPVAGFHRLSFHGGRVLLTLLYGEAQEVWSQVSGQIDAWYLDGFAPGLNPRMWKEQLFHTLARKTAPEGTLATYSAASRVRRALSAAGFAVEKHPGFGGKREMIRGYLKSPLQHPDSEKPYFNYPPAPRIKKKEATVLGAGLAGCSLAYKLAKRGWTVHVLERQRGPAGGASGNRAGILFPYFSAQHDMMSQFYWSGFFQILREWHEFLKEGKSIAGDQPGLIVLEQKAADQERFHKIMEIFKQGGDWLRRVTPKNASEIFGNRLKDGGFFLQEGAWLRPPDLCRAWLDHPAIHFHGGRSLESLPGGRGAWGPFETPVLILANAWEAARFAQTQWLPLAKVRGQVTYLPSPWTGRPARCLLSFGGYWIPLPEGDWECGATFERGRMSEEVLPEGHQKNLGQLKKFLGPPLEDPEISRLQGRVAFRTLTHDRWPVVGPVSHETAFLNQYRGLRHGHKNLPPNPPYHEGLYLHTAHGSKGLISSSLGSELLASHLNGEPLPVPDKIVEALHPARFLVKKAKIGSGKNIC